MKSLSIFSLYKRSREIVDFSKQIISSLTEEEVAKLLVKGLRKLMMFDAAVVYFVHEATSMLYPMIVENPSIEFLNLNELTIPLNKGIIGFSVKSGKPELVANAHTDPRSYYPERVKFSVEQLMVFPLKFLDRCWGALVINRYSEQQFGHHEFEVAEYLTSFASLALSNITLIKQIKEKEKSKNAILSAIPDTILRIKKIDNKIRFFDCDGEELNRPSFISSLEFEEFQKMFDASINSRQSVTHDYISDQRDLAEYFETRFIPISSAECLSITRNITELKRAQQDLIQAKIIAEESMRAKQSFLAKMSHELRTPINGILGLTNLMFINTSNQETCEYLRNIKSSGEHLLAIVNDVLDLSKIEAGKLKLEELVFSPQELLLSIQNSISVLAYQKGIELKIFGNEVLPEYIIGDPLRVSQILFNITSNAIKFTEKGYVHIRLSICEQNGNAIKIKFEITDTGIGIEADKLDKIFENFTQADNKIAAKFGGTGLGLTIVKQLTEMQNGTLTVDSTYGKGSKFIVELPFMISESKPLPIVSQEEQWKALTSFKNFRVLIAEDNPINQKVVVNTLKLWNLDVTLVPNGLEAVSKCFQEDFDLIIMDVQMPKMDGMEATRIIRNNVSQKKKDIPILIMTASVVTDSMEFFYTAGANDYISKPFNILDLHRKISSLLNIRNSINLVHNKNNQTIIAHEPELISFKYFKKNFISSMYKHSKEEEQDLMETIVTTMPDILNKIGTALQIGDLKMCKKNLHKLKGSFGITGNKDLYEYASHLEKNVRNLAHVDYQEKIHELITITEELLMEIKSSYNNFFNISKAK